MVSSYSGHRALSVAVAVIPAATMTAEKRQESD